MTRERRGRALLIEAAVIVGSILLAFAIDAAWDRAQESTAEAELLTRLSGELDFFQDVLIPQASSRTDEIRASIDLLLKAIHSEEPLDQDQFSRAMHSVAGSYQFAAASPVFDLLTSDGGLTRVQDPAISEALGEMAAYLALVGRFEAFDDELINAQLIPFLIDTSDRYANSHEVDPGLSHLPPSRFETDPSILSSRRFSGLLAERRLRLERVDRFRSAFADAVVEAKAAVAIYSDGR